MEAEDGSSNGDNGEGVGLDRRLVVSAWPKGKMAIVKWLILCS